MSSSYARAAMGLCLVTSVGLIAVFSARSQGMEFAVSIACAVSSGAVLVHEFLNGGR